MHNRKKTIKLILSLFVMAIVFSAYGIRVHAVNQEYKNAPVKLYVKGEEVGFGNDILMDAPMEGYTIQVDRAEILTYEEFLDKYQGEDDYSKVPDKIYDVSVTLKNTGARETTGVNLSDLYIQGISACASMDMNMYTIANPKLEGNYAVALREGTEMQFHLPFALWINNFRNSSWDHLEQLDMKLVATLYPVKKMIHLE